MFFASPAHVCFRMIWIYFGRQQVTLVEGPSGVQADAFFVSTDVHGSSGQRVTGTTRYPHQRVWVLDGSPSVTACKMKFARDTTLRSSSTRLSLYNCTHIFRLEMLKTSTRKNRTLRQFVS